MRDEAAEARLQAFLASDRVPMAAATDLQVGDWVWLDQGLTAPPQYREVVKRTPKRVHLDRVRVGYFDLGDWAVRRTPERAKLQGRRVFLRVINEATNAWAQPRLLSQEEYDVRAENRSDMESAWKQIETLSRNPHITTAVLTAVAGELDGVLRQMVAWAVLPDGGEETELDHSTNFRPL